jgi:putative oxidoreductase
MNILTTPPAVAPFGYSYLIRGFSSLQSLVLLGLRLYWGWQFSETGWGKLTHIDKVTSFFQSLGIPLAKFNVILAGSTECFGGLLLLLGFGSRLVPIPLIFTLMVAYLTADSDSLKAIFTDPDKFVTATPFEFMLAAVLVLVFGPGMFSLDYLIGKYVFGLEQKRAE